MTRSEEKRSPSTRGRVLGWIVRIGIFVGLFLGISYYQQSDLIDTGVAAPDFTARELDGSVSRLSDYRGKPVLLHFWATWCGVCQREFSMLNSLHESLGDDAVLLSVVADGDNPELEAFVAERELKYKILRADRELIRAYRIGAFPTNYFISSEGNVVARTVGMSTTLGMKARLACAN